jgi:hypothetical protein
LLYNELARTLLHKEATTIQASNIAPVPHRNPYSAGDVEAARFAAEIDEIAEKWDMESTEAAIRWQNANDAVTKQPTTISGSTHVAGVQLSFFDLPEAEEEPEINILPNLAKYHMGKDLLQRARLLKTTKRHHISHKGPVICWHRAFYTLVPNEQ